MKIVEIFKSIDGEGIRAGLPTVFVRLFGCNLHCSYCDTRYGCEGNQYSVLSIEDVIKSIELLQLKRVTITGGEPMIHDGIYQLIDSLVELGYDVNVETNGTKSPYRSPIHDYGSLFYTMDWKCKSSGMEDQMSVNIINQLRSNDVLKFVVGSIEDMNGAVAVIKLMTSNPTIYFSPVFGQIEPKQIVQYLLDNHLDDCRVQLQLHKYVWPVDMRGV